MYSVPRSLEPSGHLHTVADEKPAEYAAFYRAALLTDIVPFWMRHGLDTEFGGISNVLDDAGHALNHDKYLWSQGRALWTFSALYNRVEPRAEWLHFAEHIYRYLQTHGRDEAGRWMYRLDETGAVQERDTSIYVDGFVMNGLGEYFRATGEAAAVELALQTWENIDARLRTPGSYGTAPYEIPAGTKTHGVAMIFSFFFYNLAKVAGRHDIRERGLELGREILRDFYSADKDAILEFVRLDGGAYADPLGRVCVPGHAIEALWFLITIFDEEKDEAAVAQCCRLIRRHIELGWNAEFGGLRLALDVDGGESVAWKNADCKPWWVQVEALVATALAYRHTGDPWFVEWHERIRAWAFARYPVPTGEWRQWVTREGKPMASSALPVKDPFHLPRALMYLTGIWGEWPLQPAEARTRN